MNTANPENVPLDKIPAGWRLLYANEYENDKVLCRVWDCGRFTEVQLRANYRKYTYITPDLPDNGQPWHAHKPGDPAPVGKGVKTDVVWRNGNVVYGALDTDWSNNPPNEADILFYRLHDPAPMKTEYQQSTSDRILSILIAAGHITEEQVEQARKLVKP